MMAKYVEIREAVEEHLEIESSFDKDTVRATLQRMDKRGIFMQIVVCMGEELLPPEDHAALYDGYVRIKLKGVTRKRKDKSDENGK